LDRKIEFVGRSDLGWCHARHIVAIKEQGHGRKASDTRNFVLWRRRLRLKASDPTVVLAGAESGDRARL
jgi:hypothetical protein